MANRFESHNKGFLDDSDWMMKVKLLANNDCTTKTVFQAKQVGNRNLSNDMASDITSKSSVTQSIQEDYTEEVIAEDEVHSSCDASNSNDTLQEGLSEQYESNSKQS